MSLIPYELNMLQKGEIISENVTTEKLYRFQSACHMKKLRLIKLEIIYKK